MDTKLFLAYLPWLQKPNYYYEMKRGIEGWDEENISNGIEGNATRTKLATWIAGSAGACS
jgi:hypothetical protein